MHSPFQYIIILEQKRDCCNFSFYITRILKTHNDTTCWPLASI